MRLAREGLLGTMGLKARCLGWLAGRGGWLRGIGGIELETMYVGELYISLRKRGVVWYKLVTLIFCTRTKILDC